MESKFFTVLDPVFKYIDSGKFFRQPLQWLYYLLGVLCLILPLYILGKAISSELFSYMSGSGIFTFLLIWVVMAGVSYGAFCLWFNRARRLKELLPTGSRFAAIPALANFIQTFGEFAGLYVGVFGFVASLLATLFQQPGMGYAFGDLPVGGGIMGAIYTLIAGYVIVVVSRFFAEMVLALADIANNCEKIADKK